MKMLLNASGVFQSMPPYGGDSSPLTLASSFMIFQSTPPYGGDEGGQRKPPTWAISIHAPIRGRRRLRQCAAAMEDFNPRPHTGATVVLDVSAALSGISIHAPIRGRLSDETIRYSQVHSSCFAKVISNISKAPSPGAFSFCLLSPRACRTIRTN